MIHFFGHTDDDIVPDMRKFVGDQESDIIEQDKLITEIFAPDPITGKPSSDLHFMYSQDRNPVVAEYIKSVLAVPQKHGASVDDPDLALEMTKSRQETVAEYASRLTEICSR